MGAKHRQTERGLPNGGWRSVLLRGSQAHDSGEDAVWVGVGAEMGGIQRRCRPPASESPGTLNLIRRAQAQVAAGSVGPTAGDLNIDVVASATGRSEEGPTSGLCTNSRDSGATGPE